MYVKFLLSLLCLLKNHLTCLHFGIFLGEGTPVQWLPAWACHTQAQLTPTCSWNLDSVFPSPAKVAKACWRPNNDWWVTKMEIKPKSIWLTACVFLLGYKSERVYKANRTQLFIKARVNPQPPLFWQFFHGFFCTMAAHSGLSVSF